MFKRGTDQIGFSAGGTEMLALTSTGIFADKLGSKSTGSDLTLVTSGDIILDANVSVSSDTYLSNTSTTGSQITLNSDNTASWTGTRELISFESVGNGADHRTGTLSVKLKKGPSDSTLTEFIQVNAVSNYTAFNSGNLLVGTTDLTLYDETNGGETGFALRPDGRLYNATQGNTSAIFNRLGTGGTENGTILQLRSNGSTVGSIFSSGGIQMGIGDGDTGLLFGDNIDAIMPWSTSNTHRDNATDLGRSATRFKDLYLSGGVYLGGTGSANKLDDYESGNFSPNIQDNSNTNASNYGIQVGVYRKIGGIVYFAIDLRNITATNLNGSDAMKVSGLPFTSASSGSLIRYPVSYAPGNSNGFGGETNLSAYVNAGTDDIYLLKYSSGLTSPASVTITELLGSATNRDFWIAGTYPV
jgi:hypothetical protein